MRKLAPMILITSIAVAGTAFATDLDKNGQPTVSPNTQNIQGNSYSDKSPLAKGTNAPMDETAKAKAEADHAKKKSMKTAKHAGKMDKSAPVDTTTMGTTSATPATPAEGVTAGSTSAIRDNSTGGKNGQ